MSPKMESVALTHQLDTAISDIQATNSAKGVCGAHWPLSNGIKLLLECEKAHIEERAEIATAAVAVAATAVVKDAATVRETAEEVARLAAKEVIREAGIVGRDAATVSWGKFRMTGSAAVIAAVIVGVGAVVVGVSWFQNHETRSALAKATIVSMESKP